MRLLRWVVVLLVLVGVALAGADVVVRQWVEHELAGRVAAEVGATEVRTRIDSFPFLGRLLVAGEVGRVRVEADGVPVPAGGVEVARVLVDVTDLRLDQGALVSDRRLVVRDVGRVTVEAEVDEAQVEAVTGVGVRFTPGVVTVRVGGQAAQAGVSVVDNQLLVDAGLLGRYRVPLPDQGWLPCALDVAVLEGAVRARCALDDLPDVVRDALASEVVRAGG